MTHAEEFPSEPSFLKRRGALCCRGPGSKRGAAWLSFVALGKLGFGWVSRLLKMSSVLYLFRHMLARLPVVLLFLHSQSSFDPVSIQTERREKDIGHKEELGY